jgi:acylphosphatase
MEDGTVRCHLWVSGSVQGVGFRMFTERAARRRGVVGYVRNLADGRVEAVAEGPGEAVRGFIADLRRGPSGALVRDVGEVWETPEGLRGFRIG